MRRVVAVVRMKESVLVLSFSLGMALVLACGVVLLGAARPAGAAPAAEEGKILFFSFLGSTRGLETINPDGSGRSSFSPPINGAYPEWSDDGTKFVYVDQVTNDIVISSAEGTDLERTNVSYPVHPNIGIVEYPTLSPDGTKVAFATGDYVEMCDGYGNNCTSVTSADIFTMNVDGSNLTQLDSDFPREVWFNNLDWSPDGDKIALSGLDWNVYYYGSGLPEEIYTVKADGTGQPTHFADPVYGFQPAWSPDGSKIAYWREHDLHIMNADGSGKSDLTTDGTLVEERKPAWSPKGNRLVFSGEWLHECPNPDYDRPDRDLFTIDVDGSNLTNITNTVPACDPEAESAFEWTPSWQPVFPPSDTTAPQVSETNPSNNATGVRATADITATFLEEGSGIDPNTLTNSTFKVVQVKPTGNVAVSGDVTYQETETSKKATFDPSTNLAKGLYKATITTGVKDKAGNAVSHEHTWLFTTAGPSKK